jgi:hypothetical protein
MKKSKRRNKSFACVSLYGSMWTYKLGYLQKMHILDVSVRLQKNVKQIQKQWLYGGFM